MPADTMGKQTASPLAGAPASGSHTPDKPKNASEHRKVSFLFRQQPASRGLCVMKAHAGRTG